MERTLKFNKWLAEYKPIEFNEDCSSGPRSAFLLLPEYQFIIKYLKQDNPCRDGYPLDHCALLYYRHFTKRNGIIVPSPSLLSSSNMFFMGFIVTKKPGKKYDDAIKFKYYDILFMAHYDCEGKI